MKPAITFAVLAFSLMPTIASAGCRGEKVDETAASCIPGMTWDTKTATCVGNPTS